MYLQTRCAATSPLPCGAYHPQCLLPAKLPGCSHQHCASRPELFRNLLFPLSVMTDQHLHDPKRLLVQCLELALCPSSMLLVNIEIVPRIQCWVLRIRKLLREFRASRTWSVCPRPTDDIAARIARDRDSPDDRMPRRSRDHSGSDRQGLFLLEPEKLAPLLATNRR
jgi:hypothetical protein